MLGGGEKSEREQGSDKPEVLGKNGVLVRLLTSIMSAASEEVTVGTERAYLFC